MELPGSVDCIPLAKRAGEHRPGGECRWPTRVQWIDRGWRSGHKPAGPIGRRSELASVRDDRPGLAFCHRLVMRPLAELRTAHTHNAPKRAAARMEQDEQLGGFMSVRRRDETGLRAPLIAVREKRLQLRTMPSRVAFWVAA